MKKIGSKKGLIIIGLIFFVFISGIYYFNIMLPIIKTYSKAEVNAATEKAVNIAISNVINRTLNYDTLIDITYSSTGEIISFSANKYEINTITREIVKETQYQMNTLGCDGLNIKLGTFLGVPFFIERGPNVNLKLMPIGAVKGEFVSEFNAVGINMTKHSLFLYINTHVSIVLPIKNYDVNTSTQILLAESIIVGKVPEVYLQGGSLNKLLNLVP